MATDLAGEDLGGISASDMPEGVVNTNRDNNGVLDGI